MLHVTHGQEFVAKNNLKKRKKKRKKKGRRKRKRKKEKEKGLCGFARMSQVICKTVEKNILRLV